MRRLPVLLVALLFSGVMCAETYEVVHSLDGDRGAPRCRLWKGPDGSLYGTSDTGGIFGKGSVFVLRAANALELETLHSFSGPDGANPLAGLTLGPDGLLYGTTSQGGNGNAGTIFQIDPSSGWLTVIHHFQTTDGWLPESRLLLRADGSVWGTARNGGQNLYGTVFRLGAGGMLTTMHTFLGTDGANPAAGLIAAADGWMYGTTSGGGGATARCSASPTAAPSRRFTSSSSRKDRTPKASWSRPLTAFTEPRDGRRKLARHRFPRYRRRRVRLPPQFRRRGRRGAAGRAGRRWRRVLLWDHLQRKRLLRNALSHRQPGRPRDSRQLQSRQRKFSRRRVDPIARRRLLRHDGPGRHSRPGDRLRVPGRRHADRAASQFRPQ